MSENLTTIQELLTQLSDQELTHLRAYVLPAEVKRRESEPYVADAYKELREKEVLPAPKEEADTPTGFDQWTDPGQDKAKAYLQGDKVFLQSTGRVYESVSPGLNFETPGADNPTWRDVTDVLFPPPSDETEEGKSKATWDTDLDYKTGDHVVYAGQEYEVIKDHHAQPDKTPGTSPDLYKQI